jgi:hypothetical protein
MLLQQLKLLGRDLVSTLPQRMQRLMPERIKNRPK